MTGAPAEDELIAYADERVSEPRAAEIGAWLAEHPDDEKRVREWRRQTVLLRSVLDPAVKEPVPAELTAVLYRRKRRWLPVAVAACLAALLAFPLGVYFGDKLFPPGSQGQLTRIASNGLATHRLYVGEVRHAVEVAADDEPHLTSWLSKRTEVAVKPPDLSGQGLKLLGGRLVPGDGRPAAQLMYEGPNGERFTLLFERSASKGPTAFRYLSQGSTAALYWVENNCAYVLAGPAERGRLQTVASAAYDQLDE